VFVTALYTFRMLFMTFHGPERFRHPEQVHTDAKDKTVGHEEQAPEAHGHGDDNGHGHAEPHESPAVVTIPLIALAIPSILIGFFTVGAVLYGDYFGSAIKVLEPNNVLGELGREFHGAGQAALDGLTQPPFWFAAAGVFTAWLFFLKSPSLADKAASSLSLLRKILINKYYFDWFNENVIAKLTRGVGIGLWKAGDQGLIDGALVNGSAHAVRGFGGLVRKVQSGYLYSYAFWMVIGLAVLLGWFLRRMTGG
jgi:NADH-quinone oxidoreductase subunit L